MKSLGDFSGSAIGQTIRQKNSASDEGGHQEAIKR
jgi:hypothetical protein